MIWEESQEGRAIIGALVSQNAESAAIVTPPADIVLARSSQPSSWAAPVPQRSWTARIATVTGGQQDPRSAMPARSQLGRSKLVYNDKVTPKLPRRVRGLPTKRLVTADGPHPTVKAGPTARPDTGVILGAVPLACIHSDPHRSPADNHGQRRSSIDLRRSPSSQVTVASDLALGAGGRLVEAP